MSDIARRRCTGTNRAGEQCGLAPIAGGAVCALHGGRAPQVRAKAQARLLSLVEPVLTVFEEIVESWRNTRCDKCGQPTADPGPVIRVGQLVLDRSGFGPSAHLTVSAPSASASVEDEAVEWMTTAELQLLRDVFDAATERMQAGEIKPQDAPLALMPVVDGVCIEEEPAGDRVIGGNDGNPSEEPGRN